jgi:predicted NBD/HSP70 family sugar kinase
MVFSSPMPLIHPAVVPPLDPEFVPLALVLREYERGGSALPAPTEPVVLALERDHGQVSVFSFRVQPPGSPHDDATHAILERIVKFLLWQIGGWKLTFAGPSTFGDRLAQTYSPQGARHFDVALMQQVYDRPFEVALCAAAQTPNARETGVTLGGHLDGCRLGFDLGASDYKLAAVRDGQAVFTTELPWDPKHEPDPEVHFRRIQEGLQLAAAHLPRVDAIGGSAAGIYIGNEVKVASLFRAVPEAAFAEKVRPLFHRLQRTWNVPLEVANDGDVTALAAAMALGVRGILGIAMGSSQAAGYLDPQGRITGWLNELAFAPVDANPHAPADEWSGDLGVGAQYFSQQATGRLLKPAGIQLEPHMPLPEKLQFLQGLMQGEDTRARRVYQTLGVYLGYALAQYARFYNYAHVLLLGRVTTGPGAELMVGQAQHVLSTEFPDLADRITLHLPDEKTKRVGQAVAAASLPRLQR